MTRTICWMLRRNAIRPVTLILGLVLAICGFVRELPVAASDGIPPTWDIVTDDFESGPPKSWEKFSEHDLRLVPGGGRSRSTGLSVTVGQHESYLRQTGIARAEEGYLSFWFDPNNVSIPDWGTLWIPGTSIRVATVKGTEQWQVLVALRLRRPGGQGCKAFLEWEADDGTRYDYESGEFDLIDGWQKITLGYRVDEWVAIWLNDVLVREVAGVAHKEARGEIIEVGNTKDSSDITPSGELHFDEVVFQVPRVDDLWVDAINGDDGDDGLTLATALRTIQKAADLAGPGTTVHIVPGVYRETVWPALSGSTTEPAYYLAENGPGTAVIRGSEPASSLAWTQLTADTIGLPPGVDPTDIYYADLSSWELGGPPRFVVEMDSNGEFAARLPLAREPDWQVTTEWKHHEFWWAADGGSEVAGCDPATDQDPNCDYPSRSTTQLTDRTNDTDPAGIEPGNLATLGDLTGASLVVMDTRVGHYAYRRTIVGHDVFAGRVTVDGICEWDSGSGVPGLGWGSKYYVQGVPYLLDSPGEWWYDQGSGRLYLWARTAGDPATMKIEISRRDNGFQLENRSYVTLDGLTMEFFNGSAVQQVNSSDEKSYGNTVRNATLRYANRSVYLGQGAGGLATNITTGFTLEQSEIAYADTHAIYLNYWWDDGSAADSFTHAGIVNTVIRDNEMHHLGFRSDDDNAVGARFQHADKLRLEGNHIHHVAHNGMQFSRSVIQSSKEYGFRPEEIKTGNILVKDNLFEKACQLTADCGALKFWGNRPDNHVFRDVLITGNVFRNTFGWTYISEKRGRWSGGTGSDVQGMGGFGLYVDLASGIHAYRNIAYNNAFGGFWLYGNWQDGDIVYYNNVAANSLYGLSLGGLAYDTHGSVNTQVVNNIIVNNEGHGILQADADGDYGNLVVDHNLYYSNGWRAYEDGGVWKPGVMAIDRGAEPNEYYATLADIQANSPWEIHGTEGDPSFWDYDPDDHDLHDGSWPEFHLTPASVNALDRGTTALPASLAALMDSFGVDDPRRGSAYDIGRFERGFDILPNPSARALNPGGVACYRLYIFPPDLPHTVTLTVTSPSPSFAVAFNSTVVAPGAAVTLTVTDTNAGPTLGHGVWYTIPITGTGGSFTQTTTVSLLYNGEPIYLPLILKQAKISHEGVL